MKGFNESNRPFLMKEADTEIIMNQNKDSRSNQAEKQQNLDQKAGRFTQVITPGVSFFLIFGFFCLSHICYFRFRFTDSLFEVPYGFA